MRYGTFKYGSAKYGASEKTTRLWAVLIDWDGDGVYDGYNEARNMTGLHLIRGRSNPVDSSGKGFQTVDTGRLTIELDNTDGRYNPFNQASPIWPYVRPGVRIKVLTTTPDDKVSARPVFTGRIDDVLPISGNFERVKITALDGMEWLDGASADLNTQVNQKPEELIQTILNAVAWPWGSNLGVSSDVVPWFWWPTNLNAKELIGDLARAYLGTFFVAADGDATFYSRSHVFDSATIRLEQSQIGREMQFQVPWEVVRNQVSVTCHPRQTSASTVLWSLFDKPQIAAGASFSARGTYMIDGNETPIDTYTTPVAGTDFIANTLMDGSGTDLTASFSVAVTVYANVVYITVTNNGSVAGYLTLLQFRGTPLRTSTVNQSAIDADSQVLYGPRKFEIDSEFLQNADTALALANVVLQQQAYPQYYPTITVTDRPDIQFSLDLFDFIDLVIDKLDIESTYQLAYIEHSWTSETGQQSESIFGMEPVNNVLGTVWTFTTQIGISSIFSF